jgi:DNA polymerase II small subunit
MEEQKQKQEQKLETKEEIRKEVKEVSKEGLKDNKNEEKEQEVTSYFIKKGFLLDNDLIQLFSHIGNRDLCEELLNRVSAMSQTRIINKALIAVHFNDIKPLFVELEKENVEAAKHFFYKLPMEVVESKEKKQVKEDQDKVKKIKGPNYRILYSKNPPYRKIEVRDFINHFKNRYNFMKGLLSNRQELNNLISINKMGNNRDFSFIGLVYSKRITKNKNMLIKLEDPTGRINALINQNKPELFEKAGELMLDDVVAVKCSGNKDMVFVNDLFFADAVQPEKKKINEEGYALFISDLHIGSNNFLEDRFSKFIDWLNGINCSDEQKNKIEKIKYIFIVGDSVDGVGVVPGQDKALKIKDVKKQYEVLASYLNKVPKHITMFMCPGQHDAVRVPEPQPPVDEEFAEPLMKIDNLVLVSNPSTIEIEANNINGGLKVLMYHGASMHGWVNEIEELRTGKTNLNPAKIVKFLLRHRHLSPTHSGTTYVPDEEEDPLLIKEVPDVMATGDIHRSDIDMYNNILIICSSCWQSITPFEEKVGNMPDPCKVPMLNLKTREIKMLDFS